MSSVGSEVKATLVIFSPVLGQFLVKNPYSDAALLKARSIVGDVEWKKGYTPEKSQQVEQLLCDAGVHPIVVTGDLKRAYHDQTNDSQGNTYQKVRIILEDPIETLMISMEATAEIASIAIQQLFNTQPGETLTFKTSQEKAVRGGRTFYNHRIKMVRADGTFVPAIVGAWKKAQDQADAATAQLRSANLPSLRTAINKVASDSKMEFHLDILRNEIEPRFK